jgi:hypothetical protein
MQTTHAILRLGALSPLATALVANPARAQTTEQDQVRVEIVTGSQTVSNVTLRGVARFTEFRAVPDGAVLEFGRFEWTRPGRSWTLSLTANDAFQDDQRYVLDWTRPGTFSLRGSYVGVPRFYSSGSTTLWSGAGTGTLTLNDAYRQAAEAAAGAANQPVASDALAALMNDAIAASATSLNLRTRRNTADGDLDVRITSDFTLAVSARNETRSGTRPLGIGTYIRRQALANTPNTGAGNFWRETFEARGSEVIEPLDYRVMEAGAALRWARSGQTAAVGWNGSWFRNDITALYFDNPFEGAVGRASATTFDPTSDQEPAAPNGNNNLRGLYSRSAIQLAPDNGYQRIYGNLSLKLPVRTRLTTAVSYGMLRQDDPFMPYAENDQVVFSGVAGQPGVVYAKDARLPQASLDGKRAILQADFRATSRLANALNLRAGYRLYDLNDDRPGIEFPGYASSSDSYFRRGVGQLDEQGNRVLFNEVGGYRRQRFNAGAAYRIQWITLDGEYLRTAHDYEARQVARTTEDAVKATVRVMTGGMVAGAHYLMASRGYVGTYEVGLETSGVRAYDVWTRDRDQVGLDLDFPVTAGVTASAGGSYTKDVFPGAVSDGGFEYGYGLQNSKNGSVFGGVTWGIDAWSLGAWGGYDLYEVNSLQVTKTGLAADYDPTNRWSRASSDDVIWAGFDVSGRIADRATVRADLDYQRFSGTWETVNLGTPDVNSAVAYAFPNVDESTLSGRLSLTWSLTPGVDVEARYWFEPYRLNDFTWDAVQAYPQGVLKQTQSSATDIGDMNVGRLLWLDSRYSDYTAHVVSLLLHVKL